MHSFYIDLQGGILILGFQGLKLIKRIFKNSKDFMKVCKSYTTNYIKES